MTGKTILFDGSIRSLEFPKNHLETKSFRDTKYQIVFFAGSKAYAIFLNEFRTSIMDIFEY